MALVLLGGGWATNKGVQAIDSMDQTFFQKEIQRAINGRWRYFAGRCLREHFHQSVSTERLMALPHQLQYLFAQAGEAHAALVAKLACGLNRVVNTVAVVMVTTRLGECIHGEFRRLKTAICYTITFHPTALAGIR